MFFSAKSKFRSPSFYSKRKTIISNKSVTFHLRNWGPLTRGYVGLTLFFDKFEPQSIETPSDFLILMIFHKINKKINFYNKFLQKNHNK